jgi:glycosyltransferase involved in cell wall biosynthesis
MKESLATYGVPRDRMVTLPEGADASIDPAQFEEAARDLRRKLLLEDSRVLAYIGTMNRFRQLDFLFRVLRQVLSSSPDVHLLMVGDGMEAGDLPWLGMTAHELGVENNVTFTGRVPRSRVPVYICASDIGLSPIPPNAVYFNSSPIKILEYLALGVCCVASDIPSQRRIIDQSRGGFCVSHEEERFAEAINRLLSLTDAERRDMGMAGRRYVRIHRDFDVLATVAREAYVSLGIC